MQLNLEYLTQSDKGKIIFDDLKMTSDKDTQLAKTDLDVAVCKGILPKLVDSNAGKNDNKNALTDGVDCYPRLSHPIK